MGGVKVLECFGVSDKGVKKGLENRNGVERGGKASKSWGMGARI